MVNETDWPFLKKIVVENETETNGCFKNFYEIRK